MSRSYTSRKVSHHANYGSAKRKHEALTSANSNPNVTFELRVNSDSPYMPHQIWRHEETPAADGFAAITGKLGIHVATACFPTQQAATDYASDMIRLGLADSAGIWNDDKQVAVLGRNI